MASLSGVFDINNVEDEDKLVPEGNYLCEITKSSIKPTKAGNGKRLLLTVKIVDGDYAGNVIFEGLNIENPNPKAVEIAHRQLKQLCTALGLEDGIEDSSELHGIEFCARIREKEAKDGWPARNEISRYMLAEEYEG